MTMLYRLARDLVSRSPFQFVAAIIVVAGFAAVSFVGGDILPAIARSGLAPMVGVFTGQVDGGIPVYRLPAISVSANRSVATRDAQRRDARDARALRAREGHVGEAS
jgi:hypothetical protein